MKMKGKVGGDDEKETSGADEGKEDMSNENYDKKKNMVGNGGEEDQEKETLHNEFRLEEGNVEAEKHVNLNVEMITVVLDGEDVGEWKPIDKCVGLALVNQFDISQTYKCLVH
ncbi:Hypothetical predicted protein [Olea europaea subsp. europaea]|uniref:Uncharacterized protein n=1 Tax=Olea europaea subsp. europaea TaxID=158383 RepID=A0A8S0UK22_OLEEU|nr:Hypothetical predicted protein [Olea europaea subsp. europaea]